MIDATLDAIFQGWTHDEVFVALCCASLVVSLCLGLIALRCKNRQQSFLGTAIAFLLLIDGLAVSVGYADRLRQCIPVDYGTRYSTLCRTRIVGGTWGTWLPEAQ